MGGPWIPLPGPPFLAARSEPFVLGTWTADDLAAHASTHGAAFVVIDVAQAATSADVVDALRAELVPRLVRLGVGLRPRRLRGAAGRLALPSRAARSRGGQVGGPEPSAGACRPWCVLEELSQAFGRAKEALIVAYESAGGSTSDSSSLVRLSLQRALWRRSARTSARSPSGGEGGGRPRPSSSSTACPARTRRSWLSLLETEVICGLRGGAPSTSVRS